MLTSGASAAAMLVYGDSLPSLQNFKKHFQFQNTVIRARDGTVLYDMARADKGKRIVEPLVYAGHSDSYYKSQKQYWLVAAPGTPDPSLPGGSDPGHGIPLVMQHATIATEDASFYNNPGFDPLSIGRAAYDNFTTGHVVSGASTITQQLIKQYLVGDNSVDKTLTRKVEEVVLAAELTQKYSKQQILWYYLNSVPYGNLSVGAEAAAKTYFNRDVWDLDLAQSALLAGLPEAPSIYNPVNNRTGAFSRMRYVLHLMYIHGYLVDAQGHPDASLIDKSLAEAAKWPAFQPPTTLRRYPHFVEYAVEQLQNIPQLKGKIYSGLDVWTTLDPRLQDQAQSIVKDQIAAVSSYNVSDGALVSLDARPDCYGCVRAMVGSADYNNTAIAGQINMANTPRQPGSSFKPYNYAYAFEHGLGPATTVDDGPLYISDAGNPEDGGVYAPTDYDHSWHGVVTLRTALQNSLNTPAVRVEQYNVSTAPADTYNPIKATVGQFAVNMGLKSMFADNQHCCGWALTLGGMERGVRLVEHTSGFGVFASGGHPMVPVAIRKVLDRTTGKVLYDAADTWSKELKPDNYLLPPQYAYIMSNVLSDDASRCTPVVCEFGVGSDLYLGRPAAAKTGTTEGFTDNWTMGYTPDIVTGVWVGNADNSPMIGTTGLTGAAPIWHKFMVAAFNILKLPPKDFQQPPNVYFGSSCRDVTSYGGTIPSSFSYDVWAGQVPVCSIGSDSASLPVPPQDTTQPAAPPAYQAPVAPAPAAIPPTAVPVAPTAVPQVQPVPAVQPTAVIQAPVSVPTQPPVAPPVQPAPTTAPAAPIAHFTP